MATPRPFDRAADRAQSRAPKRGPSLQRMLTLPVTLLVLLLVGTSGALWWTGLRATVDSLSEQLVRELADRVTMAIDAELGDAPAVLDVAFPAELPLPDPVSGLDALRERLWVAAGTEGTRYVFFADALGNGVGLKREGERGQLRVRRTDGLPRQIYTVTGPASPLDTPTREERTLDLTTRPWFQSVLGERRQAWSPIYVDFSSGELVTSLTRRLRDEPVAVGGLDVMLAELQLFLRTVRIPEAGVAVVLEADGRVVATSAGPNVRRGADGRHQRLAAADADPLVAAAWAAVRAAGALPARTAGAPPVIVTRKTTGPGGEVLHVAYARLTDPGGLDWQVVAAIPQTTMLRPSAATLRDTVIGFALLALAALLAGWVLVGLVVREMRRLARSARGMGAHGGAALDGAPSESALHGDEPGTSVLGRSLEIADVDRSLRAMRERLATDPLTGLANREAVVQRIDQRTRRHRRRVDPQPFAVLFIDLNAFKRINDEHGHAVGDKVLQEVAQRMREAVRAEDVVARYAGDEFVVVVDTVHHPRAAERVRDHLEARLRQPLRALRSGGVWHLDSAGAAIGIAHFPRDGHDAASLLRAADADMYRRKAPARGGERSGPDA